MNTNRVEAAALVRSLLEVSVPSNTEVILGVPFVFLAEVIAQVQGSGIKVAAQNCHQKASGAYTGEVSAPMLRSVGVDYVILGHSERREYFGESDVLLAEKLNIALDCGLKVIFCCGEPLSIREEGTQESFVAKQLRDGLFHLGAQTLGQVIIAYEPIWAIGTGVTASKEQAQEMHRFLRSLLTGQYGASVADQVSILYGGSVGAANAAELFAQPDVDGGLVGGASLKAADFAAIIRAHAG